MSHFIGDDGKKYPIFGEGGVKRTSKEFNKEFLGEIGRASCRERV